MKTRLIWNFEVSDEKPILFESMQELKEEHRWEARFFWDDKAVICLNGLTEEELQFRNVETKHQKDTYILHPKESFNFKLRREELLYKPEIAEKDKIFSFGKKINLNEIEPSLILPFSKNRKVEDVLAELQKVGKEVAISKDILTYTFLSKPKIKLELSRLKMGSKVFFSLCLQARSFPLVAKVAKDLLANKEATNYVTFIKQNRTL